LKPLKATSYHLLHLVVITRLTPVSVSVCRLCRQEAGDPEKLGEFMQKDNLNLHYFCLILSSGLPQRGEDDNGFHGFLPEDIKKEVTRASKKQYAHSSAVHFFKCPQCNNREEFHEEMLRMGIHIPDRDASWELEPGAFSGLYQQYQHCDSQICLYDRGRNNFADDGEWTLILCNSCGSQGTHKACSFLQSHCTEWECGECSAANVAAGRTERQDVWSLVLESRRNEELIGGKEASCANEISEIWGQHYLVVGVDWGVGFIVHHHQWYLLITYSVCRALY
uniref:PHD finger protein 7 n=1 Tax=Ornithorhynchus anatinus TaxID=9258 RepID=A0A6I8P1T5_ORNAN